jgi:hypothetical protein
LGPTTYLQEINSKGRFLEYRGNWAPLRPTFWQENYLHSPQSSIKSWAPFSWLLRLTFWLQKGRKKLGIKNCAQLPINKKSTPGLPTKTFTESAAT